MKLNYKFIHNTNIYPNNKTAKKEYRKMNNLFNKTTYILAIMMLAVLFLFNPPTSAEDITINAGETYTIQNSIQNNIINNGTFNISGSDDSNNPMSISDKSDNTITGSGALNIEKNIISNIEIRQNNVTINSYSNFTSNATITATTLFRVYYGCNMLNYADIIAPMMLHSGSYIYSNASNLKGNIQSYASLHFLGGTFEYTLKGIDIWWGGAIYR